MIVQNILNCNNYAPNQGLGVCTYFPAPFIGLLAFRKGRTFSATELNNFLSTISTGLVADNPANRIYWIGQFNTITAASNDPTTQNLDDGSIFYPRDPVWNLQAIVANSSLCRDKNLQKFNNSQNAFDFLFVDANLRVIGQNYYTPDGGIVPVELRFAGVNFQNIYVMPQTLTTNVAIAQSQVNFNLLNVKAFQANIAIADLSNTSLLSTLALNAGIQDVKLTLTGITTTTLKFIAKGNCGNDNLGLVTGYAAAANFVLYNVSDAAAITPTAVAVNATTGEITMTFVAQGTAETITLKQTAPSVVQGSTGIWLETPVSGQIQTQIP